MLTNIGHFFFVKADSKDFKSAKEPYRRSIHSHEEIHSLRVEKSNSSVNIWKLHFYRILSNLERLTIRKEHSLLASSINLTFKIFLFAVISLMILQLCNTIHVNIPVQIVHLKLIGNGLVAHMTMSTGPIVDFLHKITNFQSRSQLDVHVFHHHLGIEQ